MKDKYDYVSGESIDSEEEFLVKFDQDAVQGINFDKNFSEYEQGESEIFVKGILKNSFSFWQKVGASQNVLDTIANGYKIPFFSTPEPAEFQNNRSATNNYDFVTRGGGELPYEEYMGVCHELGSYFQEKIPKRVCQFFTKIPERAIISVRNSR